MAELADEKVVNVETLDIPELLEQFLAKEKLFVETAEKAAHFVSALSVSHITDQKSIDVMFLSVDSICDFHKKILRDFQRSWEQDSLRQDLPIILAQNYPFFRQYISLAMNQEEAIALYDHLSKTNSKFRRLEKDLNAKGPSARDWIELPGNHLLSYLTYLSALKKRLPAEEEFELEQLTNAIFRVQEILESLNLEREDKKKRDAVVEIQMKTCGDRVALVDPGRVLVKKGDDLKLFSNEVFAALFNDLLLVKEGKGIKIIRLQSYDLEVLKLNSFKLTSKDNSEIWFQFECPEASNWISELQNAIEREKIMKTAVHIADDYFEAMIFKKVPQLTLVDVTQAKVAAISGRLSKDDDIETLKVSYVAAVGNEENPGNKLQSGNKFLNVLRKSAEILPFGRRKSQEPDAPFL
eukprot:TRINITY_DN11818_c0_g1_i3.p1 TRINITY_DN11818_c0_g1~~TRINITY_DN11818_c0_g1_i3.p1  ORF type:complete len:410 (-),score=127.33 TRINITY_DN11818_c0_g1_i3:320-1549(-)